MLPGAMQRFLSLLLVLAFVRGGIAQDSVAGVDFLYPEFAHPREDALAAIERHDYRFVNIDRHGKEVPGVERYPRLIEQYGTQFVRQRFLIFATASQKFSFALRARAYAEEYNETLLRYLLAQPSRK